MSEYSDIISSEKKVVVPFQDANIVKFNGVILPRFANYLNQLLNNYYSGKPIDTTICLGLNWIGKTISADKSIQGKMNAMSGLVLWILGLSKNIILSGGYTAGPENPSESRLMLEYCQGVLKAGGIEGLNLLNHGFYIEEKSLDTSGNAIYSQEILTNISSKNALLTTVGYHLNVRARKLFRINRIEQVQLAAPSEILLDELSRFITANIINIGGSTTEEVGVNRNLLIIIQQKIDELLLEFDSYLSNLIVHKKKNAGGGLTLREFGPEYQFLVALYTNLFDPKGVRIRANAEKLRGHMPYTKVINIIEEQ